MMLKWSYKDKLRWFKHRDKVSKGYRFVILRLQYNYHLNYIITVPKRWDKFRGVTLIVWTQGILVWGSVFVKRSRLTLIKGPNLILIPDINSCSLWSDNPNFYVLHKLGWIRLVVRVELGLREYHPLLFSERRPVPSAPDQQLCGPFLCLRLGHSHPSRSG